MQKGNAVELLWKDSDGQYTSGEHGYLGKYKVFTIFYNSTRSKSDTENEWRIGCSLPGIKRELGCAKTMEEAKRFCQKVLNQWTENAGLISPHPNVSKTE